MGSLWQDSATIDHARDAWASADVIAGIALNPFHDIHPLDTLAKNDVSSITPCAGIGSDEKLGQGEMSHRSGKGTWDGAHLGRVGVRTPVGHGKQSTAVV